MREIGTFEIGANGPVSLTIGDPAASSDKHLSCHVLRGTWEMFVVDQAGSGEMGLLIRHDTSDAHFNDYDWDAPIYNVEIDSACIAIASERYFGNDVEVNRYFETTSLIQQRRFEDLVRGDDARARYLALCLVVAQTSGAAVFTNGCVCKTGLGDGSYLVETKNQIDISGTTVISAIRIDFGALGAGYRSSQIQWLSCNDMYDVDELAANGFCKDCESKPFCNCCEKIVDHVDDNGYCNKCYSKSQMSISLKRCQAAAKLLNIIPRS